MIGEESTSNRQKSSACPVLKNTDILLINPPLFHFGDQPFSGRPLNLRAIEKVLNLGLLSIASYVKSKGVSVSILDLSHGKPVDSENLRHELINKKPTMVGISCISCFSYRKILSYARLIKATDPCTYVVVGGQHVTSIAYKVITDCNAIDCVVFGEGEKVCYRVFKKVSKGEAPSTIPSIIYRDNGSIIDNSGFPRERIQLDELPFLEYKLYPNFEDFAPHVEESRGCFFKCAFCTAASMFGGCNLKSISGLLEEWEYVLNTYRAKGSKPVFFIACSTFGQKESRVKKFIEALKKRNLNLTWRTETRVDGAVADHLEELVETGLRVIDIGLESASSKMLHLMEKTHKAEKYLAKAEKFFRRAMEIDGLLLKVNLVFFAGETPATLRSTLDFLLRHSKCIDGVSAGPVMMYYNTPLRNRLKNLNDQYGTSVIENQYWNSIYANPVNPSLSLSFDQANEFALMISKMLCSPENYYTIKRYGQLPLSMSMDDFRKSITNLDKTQLPFSTEAEPGNCRLN